MTTEGIYGIASLAAARVHEGKVKPLAPLSDVMTDPAARGIINAMLAKTVNSEDNSDVERRSALTCTDDRFHELLYGRKLAETVTVEPVTLAAEA